MPVSSLIMPNTCPNRANHDRVKSRPPRSHHIGEVAGYLVLAATLFAHDPATLSVDVLAGLGDDGVVGRLVGHARAETVRLGGCRFGLVG